MPKPKQSQHDPQTQAAPPKGGAGLDRPRISVKALITFFFLFLLIFAGLLLLWSPLAVGYGWCFRIAGNGLVGGGSPNPVWFERAEKLTELHDVQVVVVDPRDHTKRSTPLSSYRHGYMPTAFILALTLATPIAWRRRFWSALWALFLVHNYIALKLVLFPVAYGGGESGTWSVPGVLRWMFWVVGASSVGWMLVPLVIWAILSFRLFVNRQNASAD